MYDKKFLKKKTHINKFTEKSTKICSYLPMVAIWLPLQKVLRKGRIFFFHSDSQ